MLLCQQARVLNLEATRYLRYKKTGDSHNMLSIDGTNDTITFSTTGSSDVVINSSGNIDVAGTVISDGLTVDGNGSFSGTAPYIDLFESDTTNLNTRIANNVGDLRLQTVQDNGSGAVTRFLIDHATGDISFYEDTGASANLTWDASADSLNFVDGARVNFGASNDLRIFHDGNHSYIEDGGTGNLRVRATNLNLANLVGNNYINCVSGGAVTLYHNNQPKIATTSTGVDITGTVVSDGLEVDGTTQFSGNIAGEQGITATFSEFNVGSNVAIGIEISNLTTTSAVQTSRILGSASTYRTFKLMVQATSGTSYHATEILLTHDGTTVYMTEYGTIFTGNSLATFDADISSGNVRLLVDPNQSASTTFKFSLSAIKV